MHADGLSKVQLIKLGTDLNRPETMLIVDPLIPVAASFDVSFDSIKHTFILASYRLPLLKIFFLKII